MNKTLQTTRPVSDLHDPDEVIGLIVSTVADAEGTSPLELQPLATVIDPDAICALCRAGTAATVEFHYLGYRVCVSSGDRVTVEVSSDSA